MVLPIKIFQAKEEANFGLITQKLKDFREEEVYQTIKGENIKLVTEILDLNLKKDSISGVFTVDYMQKRNYRRKLIETPVTEESPFWIRNYDGKTFIMVLAPSVARGVKKLLTNHVANKLSKILFIKSNAIVEVRISHETLKDLHEKNPQATKLIWFDQVDIPGIEKLCLSGSGIVDTSLYRGYLEHGKIWYVVFEVQSRGIVVGITRNSVITLFSKSTIEELINYVLEDLLNLIE